MKGLQLVLLGKDEVLKFVVLEDVQHMELGGPGSMLCINIYS